MPALHPVKKNYRKVHVTVLHWEADGLQDVVRSSNENCLVLFFLIHTKQVQRISEVFRSLYHYEVREIPMPHRQRVKLAWPFPDDSIVDERDLQIMYYLGSTLTTKPGQHTESFLQIVASPARRLP